MMLLVPWSVEYSTALLCSILNQLHLTTAFEVAHSAHVCVPYNRPSPRLLVHLQVTAATLETLVPPPQSSDLSVYRQVTAATLEALVPPPPSVL